MIRVYTAQQIQRLRVAGAINAAAHRAAAAALLTGATTQSLEFAASAEIARFGGQPSFPMETNYPANICVSVNEETGHGIPGSRKLNVGDVVKVDIGVCYDGMHTDAARTHVMGEADEPTRKLVETTRQALWRGISAAQPDCHLSDISCAVSDHVHGAQLSVVKTAFGHGIGESLHEEPSIASFGPAGMGPRLRPGMVICIEPVVTLGSGRVRRLSDGWTDVTVDGSRAAHFEHTVLITDQGPQVLTAVDATEAGGCPCWFAEGESVRPGVSCHTMRPGEESAVFAAVAAEMDPVLMEAYGRRAQWREVLGVPNTQVVVVASEQAETLACFVTGKIDDALHLHILAVNSHYQRSGVGKQLMALIERTAAAAGCRKVTLCVQTTNERAMSFYLAQGYGVTGQAFVNTLDMEKAIV